MNNTLVIVIAALGGVFWLYAMIRERYKNTSGENIWTLLKKFFAFKTASGGESAESTAELSIDALERELGIEPDHYLCDRIARINEALVARRDKPSPKKKGGAS